MDKENNGSLLPEDDNWLDEILGTATPKAATPEELAGQSILRDGWTGAFNTEQVASPAPTHTPAQSQAEPVDETPDDEDEQYEENMSEAPRKTGFFKGILVDIPHIVVTFLWLAIILVIGVSLGRTIWACCSDLMAFGKPDQAITITITDTEVQKLPDGTKKVDIDSISQKLEDAGLIEHPALFKLFATLTNKDTDISAGTYTLNSYFDYNAMINGMTYSAPAREIVTVMVPEGYNCAQIFALLEENKVCSVQDLEDYAANGELDDYWFLEGVKRGDKYCLEGYLFPDTYDFYTNDDPERVLEKFLDDFDYRFTDSMREDFEAMKSRYAQMMSSNGYGSDYIAQNQLTMHQLITLASIVEKESSNGSESFDIASVFYNRLSNQSEFPYLDADATVNYAIGDYFGKIKKLTQVHLATKSPYNTRGYQKGLPPGPICNPGIYSLYAVLDPNDTNNHYYVLNTKTGLHVFSKTYKEHQQVMAELGY